MIDVEGISKSFGETRALAGVDMSVPAGTGKTTLVRILANLLAPDTGRARISGVDVQQDPDTVRSLIGLAGHAAVDETLTGRENLVMAGQAGTDRWIMTGGIFLTGGCYLVTAAGLTGVRASARALLAVAGLAGIGIAASPNPPAARPRGTSPGPCSARSRSPCGPPSPPGAPHRGR
jgi:ABC-type branched-subunit amino acid transport system ATPase component